MKLEQRIENLKSLISFIKIAVNSNYLNLSVEQFNEMVSTRNSYKKELHNLLIRQERQEKIKRINENLFEEN